MSHHVTASWKLVGLTWIFLGLLCIWSLPATSQDEWPLYNPRIVPSPAIAGTPLTLRFDAIPCGSWNQPTIERIDNRIIVRQFLIAQCGVPEGGTFVENYPIGAFPPGNYTLEWRPVDTFSGPNGYDGYVVQFVVEAASVPSMTGLNAISLCCVLLAAGLVSVRTRTFDRRAPTCPAPPQSQPFIFDGHR